MKKILVILTGGTIGSSLKDNYISVNSDDKKYKIIELYKKKFPNFSSETVFLTSEPYTILSENLSGKNINSLIECVKNALKDNPDGIIITHGTDTLQYSAAAIGLVFNKINIPVIFVSSNYILDDKRANGLTNFALAVNYINSKKSCGVFVSYDGKIIDSLSLLNHLSFSDKLFSLDTNGLEQVDFLIDKNAYGNISLTDTSPVLYIKAVPGQVYPDIDKAHIKAVLLETYHSGTLCTESQGIMNFCETAYTSGIPIYVVGMEERAQYQSTSLYNKLHFIVLKKISPVTAYMTLWFKYSISE